MHLHFLSCYHPALLSLQTSVFAFRQGVCDALGGDTALNRLVTAVSTAEVFVYAVGATVLSMQLGSAEPAQTALLAFFAFAKLARW